MPQKKDNGALAGGKGDGRGQNGNRTGFRTDTAISNSRFGNERVLQPWVPDANDIADGGLESSVNSGHWDQFAANERLFGLKTDYDENIYTTAIDRSHPQFRERIAAAEKKAKEIERTAPTTSHVAEERVMDYTGTGGEDDNEEDKYSGVRRQDFPALGSGRETRYTPPAKRAPAAQSTVKGAPVDPAIISSQIRAPGKRQTPTPSEQSRGQTPDPTKNGVAKADTPKPAEDKATEEVMQPASKAAQPKDSKAPEASGGSKPATPPQAEASTTRKTSAGTNETPSATSTVERDVLKEFKSFASQQRMNAEKVRTSKAKADKEVKLTELRKFATSFKLSTPVPNDLVSIIAKDPLKQKEIQAKAIKNAEDVAKAKTDTTPKDKVTVPPKDAQPKATESGAAATGGDQKATRPPAGPHAAPAAGGPNRHAAPRQQYAPQQYHGQPYRNNRGGLQHMPAQQGGTLAQRLRNVEQQKYSQPPAAQQTGAGAETRAPPTGPANNGDAGYNRRHSALPNHMGGKLNPNSHEFRPSPFAAAFNPASHASAGSSPRSAANNVPDGPSPASVGGQLIRRKTKAVDVGKCLILSHIKTIKPPQGRKWDENGGLRPSYDTLPTWRQLQDDEKQESTMHLTYKEYFERNPFSGPAMATPNPSHVAPHLPHQHQLPFHLQHGQRQSPHMAQMQMHAPHPGGGPHGQYGGEDHRMMQSNSAQSFASPRMGQMPMAYPGMNSPGQMHYNQPVYMGPGNPQMAQYRSFSNSHGHYPPPQGQMGAPMMMQPQFIPGPQGMVTGPQMMYPGGHPQFMPQSGPPQPVPGANGYPSPGRPSAPAMAHQGSQQGQPMYGMSPNVQYNQPAYGQGTFNVQGYNTGVYQHYGILPQQTHFFIPLSSNKSNSSYHGSYSSHGSRGGVRKSSQAGSIPAAQSTGTDNTEGVK